MKIHLVVAALAALTASSGCEDEAGPKPDVTPPARVLDLEAACPQESEVVLIWTAPGDDAYKGRASRYDVRYAGAAIDGQHWLSAIPVTMTGAPRSGNEPETLIVSDLPSDSLHFALKAADEASNWSEISNDASVSLSDRLPPNRVTDLAARSLSGESVVVTWTAPGDNGGRGRAAQYDLRYSISNITEQQWSRATRVESVPAPALAAQEETVTVNGLQTVTRYYFALKTADEVPNWSPLSNVGGTVVGIERWVASTSGTFGAGSPDWAPDGRSIAFCADWAGNNEIYTCAAGDWRTVRLTTNQYNDVAPRWSPDGRRIAFTSNRGGHNQVWIMDAQPGAEAERLTAHEEGAGWCSWSPDGTTIAYQVPSSDGSSIYTIPASGGVPTPLVVHASFNTSPSWSPDGTQIAFASTRGGSFDIWRISSSGGEPIRVTAFSSAEWGRASWSPDGQRLAFASNFTGDNEICAVFSSGDGRIQLTRDPENDVEPSWSPDGTRIAFSSRRGGRPEIWLLWLPW